MFENPVQTSPVSNDQSSLVKSCLGDSAPKARCQPAEAINRSAVHTHTLSHHSSALALHPPPPLLAVNHTVSMYNETCSGCHGNKSLKLLTHKSESGIDLMETPSLGELIGSLWSLCRFAGQRQWAELRSARSAHLCTTRP